LGEALEAGWVEYAASVSELRFVVCDIVRMPRSEGCRVTEAHRQECLCHWSQESQQMPTLQWKRRRQSNAASVSFAVKTRWIWLLVAQAGMPVLRKSKSQKRRPEASGTKSEKAKADR